MSDDTPTERFIPPDGNDAPTRRLPQPGQDAPTERFVQPSSADAWPGGPAIPPDVPASPPPGGPGSPGGPAPEKKSRALLITLISLAAAMLVAAIILLAILFGNRGDSPAPSASPSASESASPSPTPSPTPTPTPTPEPEPTETAPPEQGAVFTSFSPENNSAVSCPDESSSVPLTFSWSSTGAQSAWIGVGTTDAKAEPFAEVDPTDTFHDISFQCGNSSEVYTVTLDDGAGTLTHATVTLVRELE